MPVAGGVASGAACASAPLMVGTSARAGALCASGAVDAVGDGNPVPERAGCSRLERTALGRVGCPRQRRGCERLRLPRRRAIRAGPVRPPTGSRLGRRLEDVGRERYPSP